MPAISDVSANNNIGYAYVIAGKRAP
ncbi:MAG: hypothetical protein JWQ69_411, partial [Pseudomonas sp.]|nr:hypothetical protein [Pseudomonas sp.]